MCNFDNSNWRLKYQIKDYYLLKNVKYINEYIDSDKYIINKNTLKEKINLRIVIPIIYPVNSPEE